MVTLIVPTPTLQFAAVAADLATLEKPIEVRCAAVSFPAGNEFTQSDQGTSGFFIYRQTSAAPTSEIWNDDLKRWEPNAGGIPAGIKPRPLLYKPGDPFPWQGILVAAGQKDQGGADQFTPAPVAFPRYFVRAYFATRPDGQPLDRLSGPSTAIRLISVLDAMRAGINVGVDQTPDDATEVHLFLRDASRRLIGSLTVTAVGSTAQVELSNRIGGGAPQALIRLLPNGDVEISPAPGRSLIVTGPLQADRIFFQPADPAGSPTGAKEWLA